MSHRTDTLSLALDGARVTGVDFSGESIAIARDLAKTMKLDAVFIHANVLELTGVVTGKYDIVYTSKGVLCWISDISRWAETIASLLRDNGVFYILESHPIASVFDDTSTSGLRMRHPYFQRGKPIHFSDDHPDYADPSYIPVNKTTYEWIWPISDVVNALIRNGLAIELLSEHDRTFHKGLPDVMQTPDGWWMLKGNEGMIPLAFSLRARMIR